MNDSQDKKADEALSRLYHEAMHPEPSGALDDAILAAARDAVSARPQSLRQSVRQNAHRAPRWAVPLALAATVVLTVSVTTMVQLEQQPDVALLPVPAAAPSMPAAELEAPASSMASAAPQRSKRAEAMDNPPAKPAYQPELDERRDAATNKVTDKASADAMTATQEAPVTQAGQAAPAVPGARARDSASPVTAMENKAAPAPMAGMLQKRAESFSTQASSHSEAAGMGALLGEPKLPERSPERWIDDIRELKRAGRMTEAAGRLTEFRKRFPDYKLPDDVK